jgi:hypothetical protein
MHLSYSISQRGNLYPVIYNCLCSLPDSVLQHADHGLRHPLAIYNISLSRIIQAFQEVLDENDKVYHALIKEDGSIDIDTGVLLKSQQELLEALLAHIDDGYQILRSLYPMSRLEKSIPFADQWLKKAKHPTVSNFEHLVKPYRDTFAPIVNRIKHEHGRLRVVSMRNMLKLDDPYQRMIGYFVEGVDKKGVVGPDPKIHGGNRAISLHRDLRYHFVYLYVVDYFLMNAIINAISRTYSIQLLPATHIDMPSIEVKTIAERISHLPFLFFFDEVNKPTPTVSISESDRDVNLSINNSNPIKALFMIKGRVNVQYSGDGVTRSWKLPYMT